MHIPEIIRDRRFWIASGTAAAVGVGAWVFSHRNSVAPELQPVLPTASLISPEHQAIQSGIFPITYDGKEWSCVKVNNPKQGSSYNPDLPAIPNAFRAIELAGTPGEWESKPYLYRNRSGEMRVVDNWNDLSLTYNGDAACVIKP